MAEKLANTRNISPFLQYMRSFFLGREHTLKSNNLRFSPSMSARDQPPPIFPPGDNSAVSANPYCKRDGRRESTPPELLVQNTKQRLLASGGEAAQAPTIRTPGKVFNWDK